MKPIDIILQMIDNLSESERNLLISRINNSNKSDDTLIKPTRCPHCESTDYRLNGSVKGRTRYKCKSCGRSFGNATGTVYNKLRKIDKFNEYKRIMLEEGYIPLQTMCSRLGISHQTAFDWRHKILAGLREEEGKFSGTTQLDDVWFRYSQKGRKGLKYSRKRGSGNKPGDNGKQTKVIVASDGKQTVLKVAKIGRISKSDIDRTVGRRLKKGAKLVSDAHPSIKGFAREHGLEHIFFKAKFHKANTGEHVQLINNQASRLKTSINYVMKGVSTKYLQCYSAWFEFRENHKTDDIIKAADRILSVKRKAVATFMRMEQIYKHFIMLHSERTYRCPIKRHWKELDWKTMDVSLLNFY
jgi:Transposase and inactivated derivatives